jgi:hypothetical protein
MLQIVAGTMLAFFAIVGAAEMFRSLCTFLLRPQENKIAFLVASRGNDEQIEYIIRSLVFKAGFLNTVCKTPYIVIIDQGMNDESKKICDILSKEMGCINICKSNELINFLNRDFQI